MNKIIIKGGNALFGSIDISGSKNLALPILTSSILSGEKIVLHNIPNITDVHKMISILSSLGCKFEILSGSESNRYDYSISVDTKIDSFDLTYEYVNQMRASILNMGPILSKYGYVRISLPGGCPIGARPVNLHIDAMKKLGADISIEHGDIVAKAKKRNRLTGAKIEFPFISVGATENAVCAATLAHGSTIIKNASHDPDVIGMIDFLNTLGAKINIIGNDSIEIEGVESLSSGSYNIWPDRLEACTYAIAAVATGGEIKLNNISEKYVKFIEKYMNEIGIDFIYGENYVIAKKSENGFKCINFSTGQYPSLPTDLQAQFTSLASIIPGVSTITECIFENRLMHVPELCRMGADIILSGNKATINGVQKLSGAKVSATDLRAAASLIIAGLIAEGETEINNVFYADRGYSNLVNKLRLCGANIRRIGI